MKDKLILQYFEWNMPSDGRLWLKLKSDAKSLQQKGITAVWIPPACKAMSKEDTGYSIYDLYDLGEFDQKGTIETKYGSKSELQDAIKELHKFGIKVYFDTVLNHKAGADHTERFLVKEVDPNNRNIATSEAYEIEGWTGFDFPGRRDKYSTFKWNHTHFKGIDNNQENGKHAIYLIQNEHDVKWSDEVDKELGNYDYLMHADIDYDNGEIVNHVTEWGKWLCNELGIDGMRLDAVKHINHRFLWYFINEIKQEQGASFSFISEYWSKYVDALIHYLSVTDYQTDVFDVPLHYNMYEASLQKENYDLRQLLRNTLIEKYPNNSITFVDNHDSEKGSAMESPIADWFKPAAYALILLMQKGTPSVFGGDYFPTHNNKIYHTEIIDSLLKIRKEYAFGEQADYFNNPNIVGLVRKGDSLHPHSGLALLISNCEEGSKRMFVGKERSGEVWYDIMRYNSEQVTIDKDGYGSFKVAKNNLAVWVYEHK